MSATWTKRDGAWAILSPCQLETGGAVKVERRNGTSSVETVGEMIHATTAYYVYAVGTPKKERDSHWVRLDDGTWGVRVYDGQFEPGDTCTVAKKSGETMTVTLCQCVAQRAGGGVEAVADFAVERPRNRYTGGHDGRCDECGNRGRLYDAVDSSGLHGRICARCSRCDSFELSFA